MCPCVWCSCHCLRKILQAHQATSPGPPSDFSCSWGSWLPCTTSAAQHKCLLISSLFCLEVPNSKHPGGQPRTMVTRHQRETVPSDSHPLGRQFWGTFYMVSPRVPRGIWHQLPTGETSTITCQLLTSLPSPSHSHSHPLAFWGRLPNVRPVPSAVSLSQAPFWRETQAHMLSELFPGMSHSSRLGVAGNLSNDFPLEVIIIRRVETLWGPEWWFTQRPSLSSAVEGRP